MELGVTVFTDEAVRFTVVNRDVSECTGHQQEAWAYSRFISFTATLTKVCWVLEAMAGVGCQWKESTPFPSLPWPRCPPSAGLPIFLFDWIMRTDEACWTIQGRAALPLSSPDSRPLGPVFRVFPVCWGRNFTLMVHSFYSLTFPEGQMSWCLELSHSTKVFPHIYHRGFCLKKNTYRARNVAQCRGLLDSLSSNGKKNWRKWSCWWILQIVWTLC